MLFTFSTMLWKLIQGGTSFYLHPQEIQVARSLIKHADERWWAKSDLCLQGCFCAAGPLRCWWFNFNSLLPPLLANNGAVPAPSVYWHLAHSPLGVGLQPLERDRQMGKELDFSQSPVWLPADFLSMSKEKEWDAGQLYPWRCRCINNRHTKVCRCSSTEEAFCSDVVTSSVFTGPRCDSLLSTDNRLISILVKLHSSSLD